MDENEAYFINVTGPAYGADPTGSADSTAAFAAAIAAGNSNGMGIFVPRGSYKIIGSGGVGIDLTGKNVRIMGETVRSVNEGYPPGVGSFIYTPTANLKLVQHNNASQWQAGPVLENLTFGETVGGNSGVTLLLVDDCNHYLVRNCAFRGSDGNTSTIGMRVTGATDASYGLVDFCFFRNCFTGYKTDTASISQDRISNCYFVSGAGGTAQNSHVHADLSAGVQTFMGCKFESNDNTSAIGIKINNGSLAHLFGCHFEGVPTGVDFPAPGSYDNNGSMIIGNSFLGSNGSETAINIHGANTNNVVIGPNRYSNLTNLVVDGGTGTVIWDRPDFGAGAGTRRYVAFGGPGIYSGSGSPAGVVSAPVGSLFIRNDGGTSTTLYVKESGTGNTGWVAK